MKGSDGGDAVVMECVMMRAALMEWRTCGGTGRAGDGGNGELMEWVIQVWWRE